MTTPNATNSLLAKQSHTPVNKLAQAPRSVPSTAGKGAPLTTAQSQHASATKAGTGGIAMTSSLSQTSNPSIQALSAMTHNLLGASPSNNLLAFASPAALAGLDMTTPSALLDAATSHPMNLSLSDLGIPSGKRNEDDERRMKLDTVLTTLLGRQKQRRFGRVSEEGVRRVGRWVGLDVEVEAKREARKFEGNRPVAVAGKNNVLIDFQFKDNLPTHVDLSFSSQNDAVTAHQSAAASVLLEDLTPPPAVSAINTNLDKFAANLETLARLDKLSVYDQLNCTEAITGVYESLKTLYEHEKQAAQTMATAKRGDPALRAERHVMCKRSGRPQMHARRRIGLSLDYWMDKSNIYPSNPATTSAKKDESAMGIDTKTPDKPVKEADETIFALEITVEASTPDPYSSLRVSFSWIANRILKSAEETTDPTDLLSGTQSIDWLEPAPTYLSDNNQNTSDVMAIDNNTNPGAQKLPAVRFVAKLNPPLAMPWTAASAILQSVGAGTLMSEIPDLQRTYEGALLDKTFDIPLLNRPVVQPSGPSTSTTINVLAPDGKHVEHKNALYVPKQDFGYVLTSIPFAHPRQVVALLPVLRQWASLGSLLRGTFLQANSVAPSKSETAFSLADLLSGTNLDTGNTLSVDVSLSTQPSPTLEFVFPVQGAEGGLASISANVSVDGQIIVLSQNVARGSQEEQDKAAQKMAKALGLVGDIGVWTEWIRKTYGA
ncbi:hypothetical protein AUEXF2481DRAFT_32819 [Aureobasidium subglaciale EXF-2481]|uniref:Mediator of RNA polymerase II transcription subunit 1 n=1 Tax=Aureobasidium subglaciale (strain EXF-2481) TaxID=1043005 RepID=A0A074YXT7_AURSE|nr:uncharacterized protein AUEXF2481DRAFT_32819 [Aureobasidium subglaciale EXF-2481]KAI5194658.1 hypothetical protein E4T38_09468 [Aureobasidium subglaciale]KAI5213871.1 hypothetical protein E4T40_09419 [Aureobasidium subglaciale]KAI5215831.1 hypothetical protein E4T41_09420 [Aureobasidium subglaciale]KAI5253913.1 hypothetical protein E4T46_09375 [Aureobasidium subglaciale]KEQ91641.1 hypothetical protein AUEXF2481DRAFT_32819 [Aureobasidium subglaciale EXF-2481]